MEKSKMTFGVPSDHCAVAPFLCNNWVRGLRNSLVAALICDCRSAAQLLANLNKPKKTFSPKARVISLLIAKTDKKLVYFINVMNCENSNYFKIL